jgi:hypothetical protein
MSPFSREPGGLIFASREEKATEPALSPRRAATLAILISTAAGLAGCSSVRLDNAARLMRRADFDAARAAAPEWCRDALKTINALEYDQERR